MDDLLGDDDLDIDAVLGVEAEAPVAPLQTTYNSRRHKVVCKHWLRGLCKKGEACDFLHKLDHDRMPECFYFTNFGECGNKECIFLHIRPEEKTTECPWYARGFCKHGPRCRHRHTRKKPCPKYLAGLCPDGAECQFGHPKCVRVPCLCLSLLRLALPWPSTPLLLACAYIQRTRLDCDRRATRLCRRRYELPSALGAVHGRGAPFAERAITCYRCGQTGHYASNCPASKVQQEAMGRSTWQGQGQDGWAGAARTMDPTHACMMTLGATAGTGLSRPQRQW